MVPSNRVKTHMIVQLGNTFAIGRSQCHISNSQGLAGALPSKRTKEISSPKCLAW